MKKFFSYGRFLQMNPNATRKERQQAVKKFYELITNENSSQNKENSYNKFLQMNPNATKEERKQALRKFYFPN